MRLLFLALSRISRSPVSALHSDGFVGQGAADASSVCLQLADLFWILQTLKYWDLQTPNPVATVQLPERCYGTSLKTPLLLLRALTVVFIALDVVFPLMVVGTAERHIQIFNLNQPTQAFKTIVSPLRWQTRTVRRTLPTKFAQQLRPCSLADCVLPGCVGVRARYGRGTSGDSVSGLASSAVCTQADTGLAGTSTTSKHPPTSPSRFVASCLLAAELHSSRS